MAQNINLLQIREALEASWDEQTSYGAVKENGNPALGQCYPTSRVVQYFFPETEIVKSEVWNGNEIEIHFWNILKANDEDYHIDLSWQQFPHGSQIKSFVVLDLNELGDSEATIKRCELLLHRVQSHLNMD